MSQFKNAIARLPGHNFAEGLTTVSIGTPRLDIVLDQHALYCNALAEAGLTITKLPADLLHPDSSFVEDTAVITPRGAILMRPGAPSRSGEVAAIRPALAPHFPNLLEIIAPGTVDGGDICEAGDHFFLGLSHRTNEEGARQLAAHLAKLGYTSSVIDVRPMSSILHLKSGISYIGDNTMVLMQELATRADFANYQRIVVSPAESYAANCVRVNDVVLLAAGYPQIDEHLLKHGFQTVCLPMSEFQKMDGGLSCLSLRF